MRLLLLLVLILSLAACAVEGNSPSAQTGSSVIRWDRSPETVVFRAEITGGSNADSFLSRNEIPLCTIYGDNHVVWLNELEGYTYEVLWDIVTDQQIQDFISLLTTARQIFNYNAGADLEFPSDIKPVVEVLTVNVNDRLHVADSFSTEPWPFDYFSGVVDFCKQISRAPVMFEPEGAWISVQAAEYDSTRPMRVWDSTAAGLELSQLATKGEPEWLTGANMRILWHALRTSPPNLLFTDMDNQAYEVVLEVPGINPSSSPAP